MQTLGDALFIADLHLEETRPDIWQHARAVLTHASDMGLDLFILGDLFESWIGDDGVTAFEQAVIDTLKPITTAGNHVYLQHGNRDFLLGDAFCEASGASLLPDPWLCLSDRGRTLLSHGDAWCTDDSAYQALRAQVRDPAWQQAMLAQPVEARRQLARQARQQSQAHQSQVEETLLDVNAQAIEQAFLEHDADLIIHGHTHRPDRHEYTLAGRPRTRMVLGDWHPDGEILLYRQGQFQPLNSRDFLRG